MTSYTPTTLNYPIGADTAIRRVKATRSPTPADSHNFILGDEWLNITNNVWWKLCQLSNVTGALWLPFTGVAILDIIVQAGISPVFPTVNGDLTFIGQAIPAAGTPVQTEGTAVNTMALDVQVASAQPFSLITNAGLASFSNSAFVVDANGFVNTPGGGPPIEHINLQTGTTPIVPVAGGITFNGATVLAGSNPVRTDGTGPNTMALEVQLSQGIPSTDQTKVGLASFDNSTFSVDANGFVTLSGDGIYKSLSPFIVGTDPHSSYPTITLGVAAAVAAGATASNPMNVYIKPKVDGSPYIEDVTLQPGVNLVGFAAIPLIIGKLSYSSAGLVAISNLSLETNNDFLISFTGASVSELTLDNCTLECTNHTGIQYTNSNSGSGLTIFHCSLDTTTTGIALFTSTANSGLNFYACEMPNTGNSTTPSTVSSSTIGLFQCSMNTHFSTSSTGGVSFFNCAVQADLANGIVLTTAGTGLSNIFNSHIGSGTASAVSIGAGTAVNIANSTFNSSNANVLTGAGTLNYGNIVFIGPSHGHNVTTEHAFFKLG